MTSPVIEALSKAIRGACTAYTMETPRQYHIAAEQALKALEENITDEMIAAGRMNIYDKSGDTRADDVFIDMLRAARGG